jgi:hypothetical protein
MPIPQFGDPGEERCENLRWKGLFIEAPADPRIPVSDDACWCLKTQICLGPDGQPVDRWECNPARGCYRAL